MGEDGKVDFDEVLMFVELITRDQGVIRALGASWDPRQLMLFLVHLANQSVHEAAYLLSKLYARGITRPGAMGNPSRVLISQSFEKAAVWTFIARNIAQKSGKSAKEKDYLETKLARRLAHPNVQ